MAPHQNPIAISKTRNSKRKTTSPDKSWRIPNRKTNRRGNRDWNGGFSVDWKWADSKSRAGVKLAGCEDLSEYGERVSYGRESERSERQNKKKTKCFRWNFIQTYFRTSIRTRKHVNIDREKNGNERKVLFRVDVWPLNRISADLYFLWTRRGRWRMSIIITMHLCGVFIQRCQHELNNSFRNRVNYELQNHLRRFLF